MTAAIELNPDLSLCDRETITLYDRIQSFGFLMALTSDWTVVRASANLHDYLGVNATAAIGATLSSLIDPTTLHSLRNAVAMANTTGSERRYGLTLHAARAPFDISLHLAGDLIILEGEPSQARDGTEAASLVRAMMARLTRMTSLDALHRDAARQLRTITGFDRLMIYRFDDAGAGEVIAESARPGVDSFLGMHFPASDIPPQARALALRNSFRIIADVGSAPVDLLPQAGETLPAGEIIGPLDQTLAITRGVSPVHAEYLCNMGVAASLSISIVVEGRLWGLITGHHDRPRLPSFVMRTAAELFGEMYSMMLESRTRREEAEVFAKAQAAAENLIEALTRDANLLSSAAWLDAATKDVIACDGIAVCRDGRVASMGSVPGDDDIKAIARRLDTVSPSAVFATDQLTLLAPVFGTIAGQAAGLLAVPISRLPRDYLLFFRREWLRQIDWSGDPAKTLTPTDNGLRLSPRKSFAAFAELIAGKSRPFSVSDVRIGETLRRAMIDIMLRQNETAGDDSRRVTTRQELLIAELNHRVRNILALVRALVTQSGDAPDVASYVASLGGRVQALARAHDQVTRRNSGPTPLTLLFDNEIAAHAGAARGQLTVTGPSVALTPLATTTLALVIHELVTNSVKYGALSAHGVVSVTLDHSPRSGLDIRWRETGGPQVRTPARRGFGSVIVERFVPFDLQGSAEIRYAEGGFEADFHIPATYIGYATAIPSADRPAEAPPPAGAANTDAVRPLEMRHVLLLEDNMIIALEAEDMLLDLGAASVTVAATLGATDGILITRRFDFAMLDVNIGGATSFALASRLKAAGTPYIFASGYGDQVALDKDHAGVVVVQKPYEKLHLAVAIVSALGRAVASAAL